MVKSRGGGRHPGSKMVSSQSSLEHLVAAAEAVSRENIVVHVNNFDPWLKAKPNSDENNCLKEENQRLKERLEIVEKAFKENEAKLENMQRTLKESEVDRESSENRLKENEGQLEKVKRLFKESEVRRESAEKALKDSQSKRGWLEWSLRENKTKLKSAEKAVYESQAKLEGLRKLLKENEAKWDEVERSFKENVDKLEAVEKVLKESEGKREAVEKELLGKRRDIERLRVDLNLEKVRGTGLHRIVNEMKNVGRKIHLAAGVVMQELGGTVPPFQLIVEEKDTMKLDKFCWELQEKLAEWKGSHQSMHSQLVKDIKIHEGRIGELEGQLEHKGREVEGLRQELQLSKDKQKPDEAEREKAAETLKRMADVVKQLKTKLAENLRAEVAAREMTEMADKQQRRLTEMTGFVSKLYSAAGTILEGLGEDVPPLQFVEGGDLQSLDQFCLLLQTKFSGWQEDHQLLHSSLVQTLEMVRELDVQLTGNIIPDSLEGDAQNMEQDDDINEDSVAGLETTPASTSSRPSSSRLSGRRDSSVEEEDPADLRRNPRRNSKSRIESYDENKADDEVDGDDPRRFVCKNCDDIFCKLNCAQSLINIAMAHAKNRRNIPTPPSEASHSKTGGSSRKRKMNSSGKSDEENDERLAGKRTSLGNQARVGRVRDE